MRRHWASASSAQAPYPSLRPAAKAHSFRCASSPHKAERRLCGGPIGRLAGALCFMKAPPIHPATILPRRRWASASLAQAPYPSLRPAAKAHSFRCASSPHKAERRLCGGPIGRLAGALCFMKAPPIHPATALPRRHWASASRPGETAPPSPPWARQAGRSA